MTRCAMAGCPSTDTTSVRILGVLGPRRLCENDIAVLVRMGAHFRRLP